MAYGGSSSGGYGSVPAPSAAQSSGGGGGGWGWLNPISDLHSVYNYINPVGAIKGLGTGLATAVATPLVDIGYGIAAGATGNWGQAGTAFKGAGQSLEGDVAGFGQAVEGVGADVAHLIPGVSGAYDHMIQSSNAWWAQHGGFNDETKASLAGVDGQGAKPQDLLDIASHQGLLSGIIQQLGVVAPAAGGVAAYAGAASDVAAGAADAATAGDPLLNADSAATAAEASAEKTPFSVRAPIKSSMTRLGENQDYSNLSAEDAAAKSESLAKTARVAHEVAHPFHFLGQNIAGFLQANKPEFLGGGAAAAGEPVPMPENVTEGEHAMAAAMQDPIVASAEQMSAEHQAAHYNVSTQLQDALTAATAHVEGQPQIDVNAPPEPGMTRLYNGGSGDQSMWTEKQARAESYRGSGGLRHIDVPTDQVEQFRAGEGGSADLAARTAGHQPTKGDFFLGPHPEAYGDIVEHPGEPVGYTPKEGPALKVPEKPGFTPSGKEDALSMLDQEHQAARADNPPPEALDAIGHKVAMPPPAWAVRIAEALPDGVNRVLSHFGAGQVDRMRFNEARRVISHSLETAQNRARTSAFMMAGRKAASDILINTDLGISREAAYRYVGEDVAAIVNGEQLAAEFVKREGWNPLQTSVLSPNGMSVELPPIAADVRAALNGAARRGYEGLPDAVRNQLDPAVAAQYDAHIESAVEGYKASINETMQTLLASRFGAHGFESALTDPTAPAMTPADVKLYRRVMSDMRRADVYRSRQPGLVDMAKAAYARQIALGEKQDGLVAGLQRKLGLTLQTVEDLRNGIPPGIRPENIDATVQTVLDGAAANEAAGGTYGVTVDPSSGKVVNHVVGYNVGIAHQFDVPIEQWNTDQANIVKDAILHPVTHDGESVYGASTLWGGNDSHLGIWKHTMEDGTQTVSGTVSIDTVGGKPLNMLQARVLGEAFQQEAVWDNQNSTEIRLSNDPTAQNLHAQYIDQVLNPASSLNKFYDKQLAVAAKLGGEIDEAGIAQATQAMIYMDHAFNAVNPSTHELGDLFKVDVQAGKGTPRSAALYQTTMPFDMTTPQGVEEALTRYGPEKVSKIMAWYYDSHDFIEGAYRGKTMPVTGRDAAETFYDVLAATSVMASPLQNLGRALSSFANMEDFLMQQELARSTAQSVMDRAMKLPPDVVYVKDIGRETEQVVGKGKGTAVAARYFETPEWRALTERTSMTTSPKYSVIDILMGKLNLGEATNADIANQPVDWTGKAKSLSDANLPVGRIRYWASQLGIDSPALQHLTELEQQVNDLQAGRERPVEAEQPTPFVSDQAKAYAKEQGLPAPRTTNLQATANPVRGRVIADLYDKAVSEPNDLAVVKAYGAFANEVIDQWEFLKKQGVDVEFIDRQGAGAYPDANAMIQDVQQNHHLFVDRTGPGEEHLMPEMNAVVDHTPDGQPITTNDAFRAVHDYFGHAAAGNTFDRNGEDIAWRLHRQMFSKAAQPALFTETVGQNSYLNFHPSNFARRAAGETAEFPEQKAALLPAKVLSPSYLPTLGEAKTALRETMHDPSLAPAYEQAMMEHGGQSSWAKLRSFRQNLSDPANSLSVTQDSVMAQFNGMRATDWNLKRFPGDQSPPPEGSVWANKSDELRQQAQDLSARLGRTVMPHEVQALLWVYTKEFIGTQDWGRLVAHRDAAQATLDTIDKTLRSNGSVDASTFRPLEDWWQEELAFGRAYSMLQSEKAGLEDLVKRGEQLTPEEQARLDQLGTIEHKNIQNVTVDLNANTRANLQDTANAMLEQQQRFQIADAGEIRAKETQYQAYLVAEKEMQKAVAKGDIGTARSLLDEYVAKWEKSIKGDAEGGNFADVARKSMASSTDSTRLAVDRLATARHMPRPTIEEPTIGELHDSFQGKVRGSLSVDPGQTGRLMMRLYHGADISTLLHEDMHLARLMAPGDMVAQLSNEYPHIQDATLTAARIADEERFVAHFMTYLHTGEATGNVPPALAPLFDNIARTMDRTYGPALQMPGGENVPQDIVSHWDGIFNPQVVRPDQVTDPLSLQSMRTPANANPIRAPWEGDSQFAQRSRQLGEARVTADVQAAKLREAQARLVSINNTADKLLAAIDQGGDKGIQNARIAAKLEGRATRGLEAIQEHLDNAEGRAVPRAWRSMLMAFQGIAEIAKADETGALAEHLGEIPDNFEKVLRYAAERGFEPTYVPDLTWQMASKHLFNHLNLSTSLEEASMRSENTGVLDRQGNADRSLEALGSAQVIAMKELLQDHLIQHIEKYYAQPHTPGDPIPEGFKAWDASRRGIILGRDRAGNLTSVNATAVVPEGVDAAIKSMSQDFTKWPFRFLFKGGPTSVWKNVLLTYAPGWYIKHFIGTVSLATAEGVSMTDFMKAFRLATSKDEFGYHWADVPDAIKGRNLYTELGLESSKPGSSAFDIPLRDLARNEGLREAFNQAQHRLRSVVNTVDALGRTAVYVKTLRESGSADFAAERAAVATGDFGDMGPFERGIVSTVLPFYSFQKAMFKILVKLPLEHPAAAGLFMSVAAMHNAYMEQQLGGPIPDQLIGTNFFNGKLTSIAKLNPLIDSYKLVTPEGIASSVHPLAQLMLQQALGAPSYQGSAKAGNYGQLLQTPNWWQTLSGTFANSPAGGTLTGAGNGDLGGVVAGLVPTLGRTWSDVQYQQLLKRIAKTQAALAKLNQPGAYVSNPDVVVPAGPSSSTGYGH